MVAIRPSMSPTRFAGAPGRSRPAAQVAAAQAAGRARRLAVATLLLGLIWLPLLALMLTSSQRPW